MSIKQTLVGDTVRFTWISSGSAPSSIHAALFDGTETLVSSVTMVSSGNGHYYADVTLPDTPGYYVGELVAEINGNPYKRRVKLKATHEEVD